MMSPAEAARAAVAEDSRLRQLARATAGDGEMAVSVSFGPAGADSPFYFLSGESYALSLTDTDGRTEYLSGRGAVRWATTEAIIVDASEIDRYRRRSKSEREDVLGPPLASASVALIQSQDRNPDRTECCKA